MGLSYFRGLNSEPLVGVAVTFEGTMSEASGEAFGIGEIDGRAMRLGEGLERAIIGAGVDGLDHADIAHGESGFAVLEVIVPAADEAIIEAEVEDILGASIEGFPPEMESFGVA